MCVCVCVCVFVFVCVLVSGWVNRERGLQKSVCTMYVYVCFENLRGFISWSHTLGF